MTSGCSPYFLFLSLLTFYFSLFLSCQFSFPFTFSVSFFPLSLALSSTYMHAFFLTGSSRFGVLWPLGQKRSNISGWGCRVYQLMTVVKLSMWCGWCPDMWYQHRNAQLASRGCQHATPKPWPLMHTHDHVYINIHIHIHTASVYLSTYAPIWVSIHLHAYTCRFNY